MPCDSQPLWAFRNCVTQACNGVGVAAGAVAHAAAAIAGGLADCNRRISCAGPRAVRTVRAGWNGVFGYGSAATEITGEMAFPVPHGAISPAQRFAMKVRRFMEEHGVEQAALLGGC